jgi:hypothetical protein
MRSLRPHPYARPAPVVYLSPPRRRPLRAVRPFPPVAWCAVAAAAGFLLGRFL